MALPFDKGDAFAEDKPALHPCARLEGFRCTIHDRLEGSGYRGCARYDCLGAGQRVTAEIYPGGDWRRDPRLRAPMSEAFALIRRLHGALELLSAARALPQPTELAAEREALVALYQPAEPLSRAALDAFDFTAAQVRLDTYLAGLRAHL